ncbi:MAG: hypothetical protein ABL989_06090 [Gammaproteobacteria bacterium]
MKHLLAGLVIALAGLGVARADCAVAGMTLQGALVPKVGVFDTTGKFIEEIPSAELAIGQQLLGCDETLGLVKVSLVGGGERWLDRGELKIGLPAGSKPTKICVQSASSRAADHTEPAVAGIDPKAAKDCVAPPPAKP